MQVTALALDPIEKKPLARFRPGTRILSVGSHGCTLHCPWCQNHDIALPRDVSALHAREMSAGELADEALALVPQGNIGLAYTYNEPLLRWREVLECAQEVHARGLVNVVVTNGMLATSRLERLLPWVDAANIDLKGFAQGVYDLCGGTLRTVQDAIGLAVRSDVHVEVTTLVVPGVNDDPADMDAEAAWLAGLDPGMTLHLSRFFPCYRYAGHEPTPVATLLELQQVALRHLDDVLLGNV